MARSRQRNGLGTNIRVNEQDIRGNRCLEPPFISKPPFKRKFFCINVQVDGFPYRKFPIVIDGLEEPDDVKMDVATG